MASVADLLARADAVAAVVTYRGEVPAWFASACDVAKQGTPVVINVKGRKPDDVPVVLTLAALERLTAAAGVGGANHGVGDGADRLPSNIYAVAGKANFVRGLSEARSK